MYAPREELKLINKSNYKKWLFDRVSDVEVFVVLLLDCIANKFFLYYITNTFRQCCIQSNHFVYI